MVAFTSTTNYHCLTYSDIVCLTSTKHGPDIKIVLVYCTVAFTYLYPALELGFVFAGAFFKALYGVRLE